MNDQKKSRTVGLIILAVIGITIVIGFGANKGNDSIGKTTISASASDSATVQIRSTTSWTAMIEDSGLDMQSYDGSGNRDIVIDCSQGIGIYSMNVQKAGEYGTVTMSVVKDGSILDTGKTSAAYGIVSLAGQCD